jgi:phage-related protein
MPQPLPYPDLISQQSTRRRNNRTISARFGDGYSQERPDGINSQWDEWAVTYLPLNDTERTQVWETLDAVGGWDHLTWQPPGSSTSKKWKVTQDGVTESSTGGGLYTLSFTLRQVF